MMGGASPPIIYHLPLPLALPLYVPLPLPLDLPLYVPLPLAMPLPLPLPLDGKMGLDPVRPIYIIIIYIILALCIITRPLTPLHFFYLPRTPCFCASRLTRLCPALVPSPPLSRGTNAPANPGRSTGCWSFKLLVSCIIHYSCLCSCLTSPFLSFLPSRRSPAFKFFSKHFLAVLLPPGSLLRL